MAQASGGKGGNKRPDGIGKKKKKKVNKSLLHGLVKNNKNEKRIRQAMREKGPEGAS